MNVMRLLTSMALLMAATLGMDAANFSGKWALPGGRGGPTILALNQVGNEVSGNIGGQRVDPGSGAPRNQEIIDGKVNGDVITFYVWTGTDVPVKQMYKGTMSGDEITFEITGGPARGGPGGGGFGPNGGGRGGANGRGPATPPSPPVAKRIK
jgi:hypothetical protein